jgi:hypothetical protein
MKTVFQAKSLQEKAIRNNAGLDYKNRNQAGVLA